MASELMRASGSSERINAPNGQSGHLANTANMTGADIDQNAILRALNLDPKKPETQALVLTCARYNLDPLLKHAVLIQNTLYVTRDGLLHVAHASGDFDGIAVELLEETATHFIAACTVYRKSMRHPFRYQGRYPKTGQMAAKYGPEMAEKVAECRTLRRAFDVSLCSREELWENEEPASAAPAQGRRTVDAEVTKPRLTDEERCARDDAFALYARAALALGQDVKGATPTESTMKTRTFFERQTGLDATEAKANDFEAAQNELPAWVEARRMETEPAARPEGPNPDPFADADETPLDLDAPPVVPTPTPRYNAPNGGL